ncbi:MAG: 3-keto-disaccharide hydrolase [Burkholderiales bacterium]
MKRLVAALLCVAFTLAGCATPNSGSGWTTLIDGEKGLDNFNRIGGANWSAQGGAIVADKSKNTSHLVSKQSYGDFELYVEFFAEPTTNSGVFIRASDPKKVGADSAYEVNIFDQRPGQEYSTGAIVNFAQVPVPAKYKAGGKWNTMEIYAKGSQVTVRLNGEVTAHMVNDKFKSGPFTLQFGNRGKEPGGAIKWRKVAIRPL